MVSPPNDDSTELTALAREGDLRAFSQLMEQLQPRLMAQALAFCGDPQMAQDLVQETMIASWKSLRHYDSSCRLFTWLYVILLRQHRRSLRRFARRLPAATREQVASSACREPVATDEGSVRDAADLDLLRTMVNALPERHRKVIRLRFYAEASEAEIAAALGISPGTVKSRLHHALEKLRRMKEKVNRLR
jgi:RNA polymerase sigma-70 factor, ECF subfamily